MYQLLKAIEHCHSKKILHRDIKPQNILLDQNNILKLADFGLARASGIPVKNYTHEVVTLWYRPPDILLGNKKYNTAIDIWSCGCILAELRDKQPFFAGNNEDDQLDKIFRIRGTPNEDEMPLLNDLEFWQQKKDHIQKYPQTPLKQFVKDMPDEGIDLLDKMLQINPAKRITAHDAILHPYFNDIPDNIRNMYKKK